MININSQDKPINTISIAITLGSSTHQGIAIRHSIAGYSARSIESDTILDILRMGYTPSMVTTFFIRTTRHTIVEDNPFISAARAMGYTPTVLPPLPRPRPFPLDLTRKLLGRNNISAAQGIAMSLILHPDDVDAEPVGRGLYMRVMAYNVKHKKPRVCSRPYKTERVLAEAQALEDLLQPTLVR